MPGETAFVHKSKLPFEFSIFRLIGCSAAVSWFTFTNFFSIDTNQDRKQIANLGALIVFLEFLQNQRQPSPLGRLIIHLGFFLLFFILNLRRGWV